MPVTPRPKVRVRVLPALLPLEIQLQVTADAIQWRYVGQDWVDLVDIEDINASVTIGTVTTLASGAPATVTNVGTAQDAVFNFGIPAGEDGEDGVVASIVAGTNVTVDSTDPAHPIVSATGGGSLTDGDKGDVVVSASGTVWTVDAGVISTSKMGGDVTSAGKALLDDADAAAQRATLGLSSTDGPQFNLIELGSASDTTLSRLSAGDVAVEGNRVFRAGGADVPVADGGTAISNYTTGDLLYASAAGVLSKLAIGTTGQLLKVAAGLPSWGAGGVSSVNIQTFTADGTYTPTAGMTYCIAIVTASGGAGGGKLAATGGAGGGGAGGTAIERLTAADIGASKAVTVGAAVTGGTGNGTSGNSSSIGALVSATGGAGGDDGGTAGSGGTGSGGNINLPGGNGGYGGGSNDDTYGGNGGGSFWGSGAFGRKAGTTGNSGPNATVPGAGGAGGSRSTSGNANGGNSVAGIVVIIEFIS